MNDLPNPWRQYFVMANVIEHVDRVAVERRAILRNGTYWERALYHRLRRQFATETLERRRELGKRYLAERGGAGNAIAQIDPATGLAVAHGGELPVVRAALDEARRFLAAVPPDAALPNKKTRHFVVAGEEKRCFGSNRIGYASALSALARSETIVIPVINYFGMLPILYALTVDHAPNDREHPNSTQMFHLDPEDVTNMKVFIYVEDVQADGGPFTALPADTSLKALAKLSYPAGRLSDEALHAVIGEGHERPFVGPAGTMVFCDTDRCLHYGGRKAVRHRNMIMLHYALPTATYYPLHDGDGEPSTGVPLLFSDDAPELDRHLLGMTV